MENILVLGGTSKVGNLLANVWNYPNIIWQYRTKEKLPKCIKNSIYWDMLNETSPKLPRIKVIIVFAGVTTGNPQILDYNRKIAIIACELGKKVGARVLLASSQAVYGYYDTVVKETDVCNPASQYGVAKVNMENAVKDYSDVCCLRIGNIAGADKLFQAMSKGPVKLDQFSNGKSPRRMMIDPKSLILVLESLINANKIPKCINVSCPGLVYMSDILKASDVEWSWKPAPETAMFSLEMDLTELNKYIELKHKTPEELL